mgnify:CR=1 FL=1
MPTATPRRLRTALSRLSLLLGALLLVLGSSQRTQAQVDGSAVNFCTAFESSPLTQGARSVVFGDWDADDGAWDATDRLIQAFSGDTLTEGLLQERDSVTGTWDDALQAVPTYDASNRLDACTVKEEEEGSFVNRLRFDRTYTAADLLDEQVLEGWDTTAAHPTGTWVPLSRSTFRYDAAENDTLEVVEAWIPDSGTWLPTRRVRRTYDAESRVTLQQTDEWLPTSQAWARDTRTETTYTADSTVSVTERWTGASWVNATRTITQLGNDGVPTTRRTDVWEAGPDVWVPDDRGTNTYTTVDGQTKLARVVDEDWNEDTNTWENSDRTRFSYDSIIPVELTSFTAQPQGARAVRLTWQTASETNNAGFALQRQAAASSWTTLRFVEGAGTTSRAQSYQFTDRTVPYTAETLRYRLQQVDLDGSSEISRTVTVSFASPTEVRLQAPFPNPARTQATVRYDVPVETDIEIAVYDLLGRRVATLADRRVPAGRAQVQLHTGPLPNGPYLLRLRAADQVRTRRFTVVK